MAKYVAFFDLDNTIISQNSGLLYIKYLVQRKKLAWINWFNSRLLGFVHRSALVHFEERVKRWIVTFSSRFEKEITEESEIWFNEIVTKHLIDDIIEEIEGHKNRGGKVVILSAASQYICHTVKRNLNMDDVICTELEMIDGKFTGKLLNYCYGKEKLTRATRYCSENNFSLDDAYFYGDSLADIHILNAVGNPVCVFPDWRLKRHARKNDWKVIN